MKVEHITLGGNTVIRETETILQSTKQHFEAVGWKYESQTLNIPDLPFSIKITAAISGAVFDIQKAGQPVVSNYCGWPGGDTLEYVKHLAEMFGKYIPAYGIVLEPVTPHWVYSIVVNPVGLSPHEIMIAGEVELYIYERLFEAWKKINVGKIK